MDDQKPARGRGASTHVERRELVAQVCRRIKAGEKLGEILAEDDDLPIVGTFHRWVSSSSELTALYRAAKEEARLGAKAYVSRIYSRELGREFCDRLTRAEAIEEVCAQEGMPCQNTVYRWVREDAEFAGWYRAAREIHAHWLFDEAWKIARHGRWDGWRGAKLAIDTIRWRIGFLAPDAYGPKALGEAGEAAGGWNVQVVRFGDLTPEDRAEYPGHGR
jgi:hypothetical protein